jgi:hypothetical protein
VASFTREYDALPVDFGGSDEQDFWNSSTAQRLRQRAVSEVDRRPTNDAPVAVYDESEPATAAKEGESMAPGIIIDASLAAAGDRARTHQRLHLREGHPKPLRYELGRDFDVAVDESNPGQDPFLSSSCKVVFQMPV